MPHPGPSRHPHNAAGDFYTEANTCLGCLLPQDEVPELIGYSPQAVGCIGCFFKRQPATAEEIERAIYAMRVGCVANQRYGGTDPDILLRLYGLGLDGQCDHPAPRAEEGGTLCQTTRRYELRPAEGRWRKLIRRVFGCTGRH